MQSTTVLKMVRDGDGIRCSSIVDALGINQNSASGTLSSLKRRGLVRNHDGKWYATSIVDGIRQRLEMVNELGHNHSWCEGYLSALADHGVIGENDFDKLIDWIKR